MNKILIFFVISILCLGTHPLLVNAQGGGAGGAGAAGGGGGAGSLLGFKYILLPDTDRVSRNKFTQWLAMKYRALFWGVKKVHFNTDAFEIKAYNDSMQLYNGLMHDYEYVDDSAYTYADLGRKYYDSAKLNIHNEDTATTVPFSSLGFDIGEEDTVPPFFLAFYTYGVHYLYYVNPDDPNKIKIDSIDIGHKLLTKDYQFYRHKLKVYVTAINPTSDTLTVKFWYRKRIANKTKLTDTLHGKSVYDIDFKFPLNYHNGDAWKKFIIPFRTRYLIPVNIPIVRDFNFKQDTSAAWQTNFLNAGVAYGWGWGRTKFFKYSQLTPRNEYFGVGPLFNIQGNSATGSGGSSGFAKLLLGGHIGLGFGSIQLILAGGYYYDISSKTGFQLQPKPWFGGGIGLSMFNFLVPGFVPGASGGGH